MSLYFFYSLLTKIIKISWKKCIFFEEFLLQKSLAFHHPKRTRNSVPAQNLYAGQIFKKVNKIRKYFNCDLRIISVKYGLLHPLKYVKPYDKSLSFQKDIDRIKENVVLELRELVKSYGKIIVMMGKKYQEIIKSELNSNFFVIFDKSGIYGYNKLLKEFEQMTKEKFLKKIEKYQH